MVVFETVLEAAVNLLAVSFTCFSVTDLGLDDDKLVFGAVMEVEEGLVAVVLDVSGTLGAVVLDLAVAG